HSRDRLQILALDFHILPSSKELLEAVVLDPTLFGLLSQVERDEIVLPAMQRPFVWNNERIYRLIDSLLREFPIGAVMLWRTSQVQRFRCLPRDVDREIHEVFNYETSTDKSSKYLVLDGQQR